MLLYVIISLVVRWNDAIRVSRYALVVCLLFLSSDLSCCGLPDVVTKKIFFKFREENLLCWTRMVWREGMSVPVPV